MSGRLNERELAELRAAARDRQIADGIERLVDELVELRVMVERCPEMRQGEVVEVNAGPPITVDVQLDEGVYEQVAVAEGYGIRAAIGDGVWVLSLPGGRRWVVDTLAT